ncbi:hypothetical protein [Amycolatopsis rifamycinica]|uniref:Uncharacterized protein n=1 Tax=Amycolatopsis rifamycinica TaxID=287986 RepID=A0A066U4V1_9PSEU|nr:hypothetical protein [Amycolatopsis rifamycinica]KDN20897.1 hypothetical protein DV20_18135 [Amycolatopsis rifamycinica]
MIVDVADLNPLPLRERFAWWQAGGRLPEGAGESAWLGVVQALTMPLVRELRYPEDAVEDLSAAEADRFLRAADELLAFLEERELMSGHEVLTRRLGLAFALAASGLPLPESPLAADRVVRQVAGVVTPDRLAEAERLGPRRPELERAEVLRLRHLKQLIRLALDLREHLTDRELAATVSGWRPVLSVLP